MRAKPKLLFVSPEPAWIGRLGAHQRMLAMIELLAQRYEVVKFAIGKDYGKMGQPSDWTVVDHPLGAALNDAQFKDTFVDFVNKNKIDVVYFNYVTFAPLAHALPGVITKVCDIHDVQHLRAESFAAAGETAPKQATKDGELKALTVFDKLVSINANETRYLELNIPTPIVTIPHIARFKELSFKDHRYPLVVGSFAKPNQDGIRQIIIPAVMNNVFTTPILLAGGISLLAPEDSTGRIIPTGPFDNPSDIYPYASVALAPLRFGGGLKIKVIEALVHGVPVAGTECAFDGIPELPPAIFFKFTTGEDLRSLDDFIARTDRTEIRAFAEAHYAPEKYLHLIEF
jgi:hypothetical protein